ncbi:helix-turn-helix transcriptional regulator [Streptomyces sp. SM1]|uniref:helix-turn-helix domain-containing protein n=1 Tax=Streptomyces sp. SM1 TaxID=402229 RepID=UPI000CD4DC67
MRPEDLRRISAVRTLAASGEARAKRQELRLSLKEVAAAIGSAPSTVHRWELGQSVPRAASALLWAKALGIKTEATR